MSESIIQLDYANAPRWHRRKWIGRVIISLVLISTGIAAWRWGPEKWGRGKLLYWQSRCMNYTASADEIVYEQDPAGTPELLNRKADYVPLTERFRQPPLFVAGKKTPDCVRRFTSSLFLPGDTTQTPIIFMHERTAHSGFRYLIILCRKIPDSKLKIQQLNIEDDSYIPGGWQEFPLPANSSCLDLGDGRPPRPITDHLRIFAGQADPEDASHFTIRYEENGATGIIDGFVDDAPAQGNVFAFGPRIARVKLSERHDRR